MHVPPHSYNPGTMVKPNESATEGDEPGRSSSCRVGPRPNREFNRLSYRLHPTTLDLTRSPNAPHRRAHPPPAEHDHRFRLVLGRGDLDFGAYVRLLLHRAESGRRPRTEFHGSVLDGQERTTLARVALMGAALVLRDGASGRLVASIRRRLDRIHELAALPRRLRDIAKRILDGRLPAAPAGTSGDLEFELGEDAGFDWIAEFSARSGLLATRPHERLAPLEVAVGELARAALETLSVSRKERHELYLQASASSDVVWSRALLMANCAEVIKEFDAADPRSDAAALVILAMAHLRPSLSSQSRWDCEAPEFLALIATRTRRSAIRRIAEELLRFPATAGRESVARELWQEIDVIRKTLGERRSAAQEGSTDATLPGELVLDLADDQIGITVNGAVARYGRRRGRGGGLTTRHLGLRALLAVILGTPPPATCGKDSVSDVNRALASCGGGGTRLRRRGRLLEIDGPIPVLTDRLRALMVGRPSGRRSSNSSK